MGFNSGFKGLSRVTEVCICTIEFNVKSPLTYQLHALTSHELTWREGSVSPALTHALLRIGTGCGLLWKLWGTFSLP